MSNFWRKEYKSPKHGCYFLITYRPKGNGEYSIPVVAQYKGHGKFYVDSKKVYVDSYSKEIDILLRQIPIK